MQKPTKIAISVAALASVGVATTVGVLATRGHHSHSSEGMSNTTSSVVHTSTHMAKSQAASSSVPTSTSPSSGAAVKTSTGIIVKVTPTTLSTATLPASMDKASSASSAPAPITYTTEEGLVMVLSTDAGANSGVSSDVPASTSTTVSSDASAITSDEAVAVEPSTASTSAVPARKTVVRSSIGDRGPRHYGKCTVEDGWPSADQWKSFEELWAINYDAVGKWGQCQDNPVSPEEKRDILDAINEVSASAGIDRRFTLAMIMQESSGCVRTRDTTDPILNPGLLQSHNGPHSCFGLPGRCPRSLIFGMIADGVASTHQYDRGGDGLKQCWDKQPAPADLAQRYYQAVRCYNSGTYEPDKSLEWTRDPAHNTPDYVMDVTNRLMGYIF